MEKTEVLKDKVNEAYAAVSDLTDKDFKLQGFKIVLGSLLGKGVAGQIQGANSGTGAQPDGFQGPTDWQSTIAARLGISAGDVAKLYHSDGEDDLRLILDTKILPKKSQALATQQIAALICAGRQAAKFDEDGVTSFDVIRKECTEYGVLNKSNFTGYLKKMKPKFLIEGKGTSQTMRVTAQGYDDAAEIAKKYLGQEK
ncbi:MAG TPA: hypothetical protein VFZ62_01200 [Candidatus Saccharimonadales bacterium]